MAYQGGAGPGAEAADGPPRLGDVGARAPRRLLGRVRDQRPADPGQLLGDRQQRVDLRQRDAFRADRRGNNRSPSSSVCRSSWALLRWVLISGVNTRARPCRSRNCRIPLKRADRARPGPGHSAKSNLCSTFWYADRPLPDWWAYPTACHHGHPWGPGRVNVSWSPCDCEPALGEPGHGHLTVSCQHPGCTSWWSKPRHDPATASWHPGRTGPQPPRA